MVVERWLRLADASRARADEYLRYPELLDREDALAVARQLRRAGLSLLQAAHELEQNRSPSPSLPTHLEDADACAASASLSLLELLAQAVWELPGTFLVVPTLESLLDNLAAARDYAEALLEERRQLAAAWAEKDEERLRELLDLVLLAVTT